MNQVEPAASWSWSANFPVFCEKTVPSLCRLGGALRRDDLAMDLGTANTLIYAKHRGIILNEPSLVAVDAETNRPVGVGGAAKKMFGKTSRLVRCLRPIRDGVIADFETTVVLMRYFLSQVKQGWSLRRPRLLIGVPSELTQVEKRAVIDAALCSGAGDVLLTEEPMAAAIGSGLPIEKAAGSMIVDIGGGTTDVAIISMKSTLYSHSIRVAGDEMDEAIQRHIRRLLGLDIGIFEAERIKLILGSSLPYGYSRSMSISGRDLSTGYPRQTEISEELVREALAEPVSAIISSITTALEQSTPEIAHDIVSRGICLAGGGSLLRGLTERLSRETGLRFQRTPDPLSCVVRGAGQMIDNLSEMKSLCIA